MRRAKFASRLIILLFAVMAIPASLAVAAEEKEDEYGDGIVIPARIAKAEVGEWASYRLSDGGKSTLSVVEKGDDLYGPYLVIRNEKFTAKGKRRRPTEEKIYVDEAVEELTHRNPGDKVSFADVMVRGRRIKAVVVSQIEKGEIVRQTYLSDAIPVYGLVQGLTPKEKVKTALKIIDYGFDPEPEEE